MINKTRPLCSFTGCNRPAERKKAGSLCVGHRGQVRRGINPLRPLFYKHRDGCKVKGCDEKHSAKGFCHGHYVYRSHFATTDNPEKQCTLDDCRGVHFAKGLCYMHYMHERTKRKAESLFSPEDFEIDVDVSTTISHAGRKRSL